MRYGMITIITVMMLPVPGEGRKGFGAYSGTHGTTLVLVSGRMAREFSFLGKKQMQWLERELLDCKGPFIIIGNGSMWSDYVSDGKDSWGTTDPEAREKIFDLIERNRIGGVLLISGDRHGARGFGIPRPSGFTFYEFESASLGGLGGPKAQSSNWDTQFYGFSGVYGFGEFTFETNLEDPRVTFRFVEENGDILHEKVLYRSQLTPGGTSGIDAGKPARSRGMSDGVMIYQMHEGDLYGPAGKKLESKRIK